MANPEEINSILNCIAAGEHTDADIAILRKVLSSGNNQVTLQLGKYNVNSRINIQPCLYATKNIAINTLKLV
ncbi:MAG: hypothetical protein WBA39_04005 [Rivularia sp. (in: cyanobacteria)]